VEKITSHFATKEDLSEVYRKLDTKFEKRFGDLDAKIERRFGEVEVKIEATKTEVMKATGTQFRWTIGIVGTLIVALFGAMATVVYSTQSSTNAALDRMDRRFEQVDRRFEEMNQAIDRRFEAMDRRFEQMDRRFERIEQVLLVPRSDVGAKPLATKPVSD